MFHVTVGCIVYSAHGDLFVTPRELTDNGMRILTSFVCLFWIIAVGNCNKLLLLVK